ncbi:hypothetical protein QKU48_gp1420 [Fadolivirus algeromassiliense]|jgi:hypothetical protein|uniref:Uncharacterized protein n=1 Tax=Fadolivirus FV1/VV64 TaxID=3070911 RepID=A0A7D3R345_9VIRU|nr:hypothetical protein QKU48_gp1420 [Fadolivirus algeromassiliense]QKF94878.1 hypothetical protein Fadolivirus_1_1420 [Fadolivirus FV1/VV64]
MQFLIYVITKLNMNMYDHITNNYESLNAASLCVCCDCFHKYSPAKIRDWCDSGKTAVCPYCWNDTVLVAPEFTQLYTEDNVIEWHKDFCRPNNINNVITFTDQETYSFMDLVDK